MNARIDRRAVRRGMQWLACVAVSWAVAVGVLIALLRLLPTTAGDVPDHLE